AGSGCFRSFAAGTSCKHNPDGTFSGNCFSIGNTVILRNNVLLVDRSTGALAAGVHNCVGAETNCIRTYDIRTATNNPNNIAGRTFDSIVASALTPVPLPNNFGSGDGLNTAAFLWNPPTAVRGPAIGARIDDNFNATKRIFALYNIYDY